MAAQTLKVHTAFFPKSAARSFHITLAAGDVLVVDDEYEHGVMTHRQADNVLCFLLDEEIYKFCHPRTLTASAAP